MSQTLDGQSALTSKGTLLFYYIMGYLSLFVGVTGLIAFIGALISASVAKKENAIVTARHCKWVSRSLWVYFLLLILIIMVPLVIFVVNGGVIPDMESADFDRIWDTPEGMEFFWYLAVIVLGSGLAWIWFLYRMTRGMCALLNNSPPKKIS